MRFAINSSFAQNEKFTINLNLNSIFRFYEARTIKRLVCS